MKFSMCKMFPACVVIFTLGLLSVVRGQLTAAELVNIRAKGVVVTDNGDTYTFSHSGVPTDHAVGTFPSNGNPNSISVQNHKFEIPKTPTELAEPGCLTMGPIAVAVNGVPMYNPFTAEGTNAVTNEIFDDCMGHPDNRGTYHYHQNPKCVGQGQEDELIGVAFDGYPIYSAKTAGGAVLTSADLDQCHGQTRDGAYEYRITADFPYILGCFHGQIIMAGSMDREGMDGEGSMNTWSSCYAVVGCENPVEQEGEDACSSKAQAIQATAAGLTVLMVAAAKWIV